MKRILLILGLLVVGFIIYCMVTGDSGSPPGPPVSVQATASPTPAPTAVQVSPMRPVSTPQVVVQQTPPPAAIRPTVAYTAPRVVVQPTVRYAAPPPPANSRAVEVERIIRACAKRAGWTITNLQVNNNATARVTGRAPNDNVANQRFLDEIQRSGILRDIENGPARPFMDRQGRSILECSFIIKWQ